MTENNFDINENRVLYKLKNLEKSVINLEKGIHALATTTEPELIKMAIIQYYEICVEVSHSFFVKYLQSLGEAITTDTAKKIVIRKIIANINFGETEACILYKAIDIRNKTSHEYKDWYDVYGNFVTTEYLITTKNLIKSMKKLIENQFKIGE